jgi:hypothetical protein
MAQLPQRVSEEWETHEGPIVLGTVNEAGIPNVIYATCVRKYSEDTFIIADNYFHKTKANIQAGSPGSLLFLTKDHGSFQIKGALEYHTEGELFEDMKRWNPEKHPGHAAAVLRVEEVFEGAKQLV